MALKLVLGGVLGGIIMFVWLGIAWNVWHPTQFKQIPDDKALLGEMTARQMESGIYYFPAMPESADPAAKEAMMEAWKAGPVIGFMTYDADGVNFTSTMVRGFIMTLFSVTLVTWLLLMAAPALPRYTQRVAFCAVIGLVIAFAGPLTFGTFFHTPPLHQFLELLDQLIGWTIVGVLLTFICRPAAARRVETSAAPGGA